MGNVNYFLLPVISLFSRDFLEIRSAYCPGGADDGDKCQYGGERQQESEQCVTGHVDDGVFSIFFFVWKEKKRD